MRNPNSIAHSENTNNTERSASTPDDTPVSRSADRLNKHETAAINQLRAALSRPPLHTTDYTRKGFDHGERGIYAIIDTVTNQIVGGLQLHLNHASAIRTLHGIALADTSVNKNPLDYELRLVGIIDVTHTVSPSNDEIIITGEQIATMILNTTTKDA